MDEGWYVQNHPLGTLDKGQRSIMVFARDHLCRPDPMNKMIVKGELLSYDSIITGKTFLLIVSPLECKDSDKTDCSCQKPSPHDENVTHMTKGKIMSIREKVLQDLPRGMNEPDKRNTHCFWLNTI